MNFLYKFLAYLLTLPARAKGARFGHGSFIGPGYDFLNVRLKGIQLGSNVMIGRNAWLQIAGDDPETKISIGNGTNIGRNATFTAKKGIVIGKKCLFSYGVSIMDHDHLFSATISPMDSGLTEGQQVEIGDDCFIGARSFILKGVKLGKHCVVGAGSIVTKSFPPFSVIVGSPAKLIKSLRKANNVAVKKKL